MYLKLKKNTVFILLLCLNLTVLAQNYTSSSKKAIRNFEKALDLYRSYKYDDAEKFAKLSIEKDENFVEVYLLMSDIYDAKKEYNKQASILKTVLEKMPDKEQIILIKLIDVELKTGQYYSAENHIKRLEKLNLDTRYKANLEAFKKAVAFAINEMKNPVNFQPENCGAIVNSPYDDYSPFITADGRKLYKTVNVPTGKKDAFGNIFYQEDLYVSLRKKDGTPIKTELLSSKINTPGNEGAFSVSQDGRNIFFTVCAHSRGNSYHGGVVGSCDIFQAEMQGEKTQAVNLGKPVNSKYWESQPSFSSDGKTIFFVSERPGGFGKSDIWKSELQEDGKWSKPENLGNKINTAGNEQTPFIHADGKTLYFSSDGHPGMGGLDLFMIKIDDPNAKPKNLGYPLNTYADESGLVVNAQGDSAFFATERKDSFGGLDIYRFALNHSNKPEKTAYIKGRVYDVENNAPLQATIYLYNTDTGKLRAVTNSDANGKYLICINVGYNYAFHVNKPSYMFFSERFELKFDNNSAFAFKKLNIPLIPIEKGKKVILKNIFFDSDSFILRKSSYSELERLVKFLKTNPRVQIEISGHTDNSGSETGNQKLSSKRAEAVYNYLLKKGIPKENMTAKGYGSSQPVVKNDSPANKQKNRRTEFKIISKGKF